MSVEWDVLVVDNNSSDQTMSVTEAFCLRQPDRFRYLFEPQQGKSHALNAGVRQARGDVLAFTDDDVTIEPTWLRNLTGELLRGEWAGTGGRTLPVRTFLPPRWLAPGGRDALAPFALFDGGPEARQLTDPPFGNNMAYRKEMFEKYGHFRTDLGPCPGSEIRGEDTEFGCRLLAAGERLQYEPSAVVYHAIPQSRVQKKYFRAWWFGKGRADVRESRIRPSARWFVAGVPVVLFRRLALWTLRWMATIEPSRRFQCDIKAWWLAGQVVESYYQRSRLKASSVAAAFRGE